MKTPPAEGDLARAITGMQALKVEHAPILAQLARDPGIAPETRALLVAHLLEEEDEKLALIAAAASAAAPRSAGAVDVGAPHASKLNVGAPHASKLSVGSLRMTSSAPSTGSPARVGTVGSLRSR